MRRLAYFVGFLSWAQVWRVHGPSGWQGMAGSRAQEDTSSRLGAWVWVVRMSWRRAAEECAVDRALEANGR